MVNTIFTSKPKWLPEPSTANGFASEPRNSTRPAQKGPKCGPYMKLVFFALIMVFSMFQIGGHVLLLMKTPQGTYSVNTLVEYPEKMDFPGITVCNNNRLQMSRICLLNNSTECNKKVGRDDLQKILTGKTSADILPAAQASIEFVQECSTFYDHHVLDTCGSISRVFYEPFINCFSIFSKVKNRNMEVVDEPVLNEAVDGVLMNIDFQSYEYTETDRPVGGQFYIHDEYSLPNMQVFGDEIKPGYQYTILLEKTTYHRLPYPYTTNCRDYRSKESLAKSQQQCVSECVHDEFIYICGCMPLYEPKKTPTPQGNCDFENITMGHCYEHHVDQIFKKCQKKCPPACKEEEYSVKVRKTTLEEDLSAYRDMNKSNRADLTFTYGSKKHTIVIHTPTSYIKLRDLSILSMWGILAMAAASQVVVASRAICSCKRESVVQAQQIGGDDIDAVVGVDINIGGEKK